MRLGIAALGGLLSCPAYAGAWLGVGLGGSRDLGGDEHANAGWGAALSVPVRIPLGGAAALRFSPGASYAKGTDRVLWTDSSGARVYAAADSTFVGASLLVGPELTIGSGPVAPYLGAEGGLIWAANFHVFEGAAASALYPVTAESDSQLNPYSTQLRPAAALHGGLRYKAKDRLALEVEAGYTLSFMQETALRNAPADLDAVADAYGWNAVRIGLCATFLLGEDGP